MKVSEFLCDNNNNSNNKKSNNTDFYFILCQSCFLKMFLTKKNGYWPENDNYDCSISNKCVVIRRHRYSF